MAIKPLICGEGSQPRNIGEGKGGWCTRACRRAHGCGLWQTISEGWDTFARYFSFVVGDGSCILFWHDKWTGDVSLRTLYP